MGEAKIIKVEEIPIKSKKDIDALLEFLLTTGVQSGK